MATHDPFTPQHRNVRSSCLHVAVVVMTLATTPVTAKAEFDAGLTMPSRFVLVSKDGSSAGTVVAPFGIGAVTAIGLTRAVDLRVRYDTGFVGKTIVLSGPSFETWWFAMGGRRWSESSPQGKFTITFPFSLALGATLAAWHYDFSALDKGAKASSVVVARVLSKGDFLAPAAGASVLWLATKETRLSWSWTIGRAFFFEDSPLNLTTISSAIDMTFIL